MTNEERQMIKECRVLIVGAGDFITYVKKELEQIGFKEICNVTNDDTSKISLDNGIIIENMDDRLPLSADVTNIPIIYGIDLIAGGGAMVVFPENERDFLNKVNFRKFAAEYFAGYCAFWNVENSEWLYESLPAIKEGKTSMEGKKTAALICARIAANIVVGREVKQYPRFYFVKN